MTLNDIANNPQITFFIGIIGLVFGLISVIAAYFGIKSYIDQRKTSKAYEEILNKANREWAGKYTQDEVEKLNNQLKSLTDNISNEIPQRAKKALLEHKIENISEEISHLCKEHERIRKQLDNIGLDSQLDGKIAKYIENEINLQQGSQNVISKITLIIAIILILFLQYINDFIYMILRNAIYYSGAYLSVQHITLYIIGIVLCNYVVLNFKLVKLHHMIIEHIRISKILVGILFIIWILALYMICYNVFIKIEIIQTIVGIISLIILSINIRILSILFKIK